MHTITLAGKQISPLHIQVIQSINGGGSACYVYYFDFSTGRKVCSVLRVELSVDSVVDLIRDAAEQVSNTIGNVKYAGNFEVSYPRVTVAERGLVSGSVCPLCGCTKKVNHSNRCSCAWHKPFSGVVHGEKAITKQRISLFSDVDYPEFSGRIRKFDNTVEGAVYDLSESDGVISGSFRFRTQGKQVSYPVVLRNDDGIVLQALLNEPRHFLWELLEEDSEQVAA